MTGVLLAVLLAVTSSAMALDGMRLWKPYQPESFGGGRRSNDGVYGSIEAILWKVDGPHGVAQYVPDSDRKVTTETPAANGGVATSTTLWKLNGDLERFSLGLHTNYLDSNFRTGTRLVVGNRRGHHGWKFSGYGLSGLGGTLSSSDGLDWSEGGDIHDPIILNPGGTSSASTSGGLQVSSYSSGEIRMYSQWLNIKEKRVSVNSKTNLINLDLAYTYRAHPFKWGNLEFEAGAKYFDFYDKLRFQDEGRNNVYRYMNWEGIVFGSDSDDGEAVVYYGDDSGNLVVSDITDIDMDDDLEPLELSITNYNARNVRNRMLGPNIGFNFTRQNQRWTFGAGANFFAGINNQSFLFNEYSTVSFSEVDDDNNDNNTGSIPDEISRRQLLALQLLGEKSGGLLSKTVYHRNRTVFSPGVALQFSAKWQWTDAVGIRAGFDSTIFDHVARGSDLQITRIIRDSGGANESSRYEYGLRSKGGTAIMYGVNLGLEFQR